MIYRDIQLDILLDIKINYEQFRKLLFYLNITLWTCWLSALNAWFVTLDNKKYSIDMTLDKILENDMLQEIRNKHLVGAAGDMTVSFHQYENDSARIYFMNGNISHEYINKIHNMKSFW